MPNEIKIDVKASGADSIEKLGAGAKKAGKEIGDGIGKGFKEAESASSKASSSIKSDLGKVEKAGKDAGDGFKKNLSEAFEGLGDLAGDSMGEFGGALQGGIGAAKGGAIAAGLAVGGFILSGINQEMREDSIGGLLAAQTGAVSGAAEKLGNVAGDTFNNNFGESIEQVGETMAAIFANKLISTDAPEAAIQKITERVLTLQQTTGETASEISNSLAQMVRTGLAGSISEAMNMIQQAQEKGLNATGELMDTAQEYGTTFRKLGLDGAESFGLLSQAVDGGARNIDIAADAIKEFGIRGQDMSVATSRGFETIGLNADTMGRMIAQGGDTAKEALRQTLNALQAMPPSVERSSAAVDLFGTTAEDLGDALFDMDLDTAKDKFGDFGDSIDEAAQKISDSTSFWDKLGHGISTAANNLGEWLDKVSEVEVPDEIKVIAEDIERAKKAFAATGDRSVLDELKEKYPEAAGAIDGYIKKIEEEKGANDSKNESTEEVIATLDSLISKQRELATGQIDLTEAQIDSNEATVSASEAMKEFAGKGINAAKTGFDLATEAGQKLQGSMNDIVTTTFSTMEAMRQQGATSEEVRGYLVSQRQAFYDLATGMGISSGAAQVLTNKLFGLPDETVPVVGLQDNASPAIQKLINKINAIPPSKRIDIYEYTHAIRDARASATAPSSYSSDSRGGYAHGGITSTAATGGMRNGSTLIDEAGPEVVDLPDGSRVLTAGATRAMAEQGLLGGGSGDRPIVLEPVFNVTVMVGDREITDIVDVRIEEQNRQTRRQVGAGRGGAR